MRKGDIRMGNNKTINDYLDKKPLIDYKIKNLKKPPSPSPSFEENKDILLENEKHTREDSIIWKYFSKIGGIYDTLKKLESAVEKPAINAFDFDEEENTYMIFITVTNSILYLFKELCVSMNKELDSETDESIETEWKILNEECCNLTKAYNTIKAEIDSDVKKIDADISKYYKIPRDTPNKKRDIPISDNKTSLLNKDKKYSSIKEIIMEEILNEKKPKDKSETQKEEIERRLENKINNYSKQLGNYEKRKEIYDSKYKILKSYDSKYNSLRESIDGLYSSICEGGELYCLNNAPSKEDGTDDYMQAAKTLCEKAKEITKDYQF